MEAYETDDDYSRVQISQFLNWFNSNIGTDYEINESASGEPDEHYIMFFELTSREVTKIAKFEHLFREKEGM